MSTSHYYHTQGIRGFQFITEKYHGFSVQIYLKRKDNSFKCTACMSGNVKKVKAGTRRIKGLKSGTKRTIFIVDIHRLKCSDCGSFLRETLDFLPSAKVHYKASIKAAAVDLAPSYSAWIRDKIPKADIVYDHFHLIKLINDKIDKLRRATMNRLDEKLKIDLKGKDCFSS